VVREVVGDGEDQIKLMPEFDIICGSAHDALAQIKSESVNCCVTSPPYWGLRDYGVEGQLGLEKTPEEYVAAITAVFREVRRVLRDDGTLWLNLGDSYAANQKGGGGVGKSTLGSASGGNSISEDGLLRSQERQQMPTRRMTHGVKEKDLIGIPWMVAFALRADGWYLRSDIIWNKPNPMPESVRDRPTRAHEYIFLLSKSKKYYYDAAAIRNPPSEALVKQVNEGYRGSATKDFGGALAQDASATKSRIIEGYRKRIDKQRGHGRRHDGFNDRWDAMTRSEQMMLGSNKRSVWTVAPANYKGAHFATFPPKLIEPCVLAGCPEGGTVLDPFNGSGTTSQVAIQNNRNYIGIEINPEYVELTYDRLTGVSK
jgi:DNA modification methylase